MVNNKAIKRTRELLVRFNNRWDWFKMFPNDKENLRQLKRYHKLLLATPTEVLTIAAEQRIVIEASYRVGRT